MKTEVTVLGAEIARDQEKELTEGVAERDLHRGIGKEVGKGSVKGTEIVTEIVIMATVIGIENEIVKDQEAEKVEDEKGNVNIETENRKIRK